MTTPELASAILSREPDITGFYHWSLFTDKPVPHRRDGETNIDYVRKNWFRLKGKVREWQEMRAALVT